MVLTKKGSKGPAVKELQIKLNKAGTKPKLAVDGLFGPLTDKAVRKYQGKNGLKADGKAGEYTLATLINGGKLPEMSVQDYEERTAIFQKSWLHAKACIDDLLAVRREIESLNDVWSKEIRNTDVLFAANHKHWERISDLCDKLIKKQAEFEKVLLEDPKKATGLVKECEALDAQIQAIGKSKIRPNQITSDKNIAASRAKLESSTKTIKSSMDALKKRNESFKI